MYLVMKHFIFVQLLRFNVTSRITHEHPDDSIYYIAPWCLASLPLGLVQPFCRAHGHKQHTDIHTNHVECDICSDSPHLAVFAMLAMWAKRTTQCVMRLTGVRTCLDADIAATRRQAALLVIGALRVIKALCRTVTRLMKDVCTRTLPSCLYNNQPTCSQK